MREKTMREKLADYIRWKTGFGVRRYSDVELRAFEREQAALYQAGEMAPDVKEQLDKLWSWSKTLKKLDKERMHKLERQKQKERI